MVYGRHMSEADTVLHVHEEDTISQSIQNSSFMLCVFLQLLESFRHASSRDCMEHLFLCRAVPVQ